MNMLFRLNEAARTCSDPILKDTLKQTAVSLTGAAKRLANDPTEDNMIALNGLWGFSHRILKRAEQPDPAPTGGHTEPARLAA